MSKKRKLQRPFRPVYPSPAALVTSADSEGKANVLALAEVFNVSIGNPVIVGIAIRDATYSYGLIVDRGEFVLNFPTSGMIQQVDRVGTVSGRDCPDKFEAFGLTPLPSSQVTPPLIEECPVNVECVVLRVEEVGDHHLILGTAVAMHVDEDKLNGEQADPARLDALGYAFGHYLAQGEVLGKHGFSRR